MSKRIKISREAESKRIQFEKKKWRGNFVKNRKIGIFYVALANWVKHDSQKAGIFRKFLLSAMPHHRVKLQDESNKTTATSKVGKPQILSNQSSGLEPIRN